MLVPELINATREEGEGVFVTFERDRFVSLDSCVAGVPNTIDIIRCVGERMENQVHITPKILDF